MNQSIQMLRTLWPAFLKADMLRLIAPRFQQVEHIESFQISAILLIIIAEMVFSGRRIMINQDPIYGKDIFHIPLKGSLTYKKLITLYFRSLPQESVDLFPGISAVPKS